MEKVYIKQLHGKVIYKQLLLLDYLYESREGQEMTFLCEKLEAYRRTIATYIDFINEQSKALFGHACIQLVKNKYYVFVGSREEMYHLRLALLEDSPALLLAHQLLHRSRLLFDKFCEESFIGESTLRRRLTAANTFLRSFNIQIKIRRNEIVVEGEEAAIRHGLIAFFWQTYRGVEWPFPTLPKEVLREKVEALYLDQEQKIGEKKEEELLYIFAVNLLRSQAGYKMGEWSMLSQFEPLFQEHPLFLRFSTLLLPLYPEGEAEIKFLFLFLMSLPDFYCSVSPWESLKYFEKITPDLYETLQHFWIFIERKHPEWRLEASENQEFLAVLLSGLMTFTLFNGHSFTVSPLVLEKKLEEEFPNLFPSLRNFVQRYHPKERRTKINILTQIYTRAYIMIFPFHDFEEEIKVVLDTDMPLYVEEHIRYTFEQLLYAKYKVVFYKSWSKIQADLILSTSPIEAQGQSVPQVNIEASLPVKTLQEVYEACQNIVRERRVELL